MALPANSVFEVRTAGSDTNGGGFVTGAAGNDYSLQDSKNTVGSDISTTDGVANGTTTFTSATANFGTTIVGNIVYIAGGTGAIAAGWYQVTARASTTSITLDRTIAASTGMTLNIGGALASLGMVGASAVSGNIVHIKQGSYSITTASNNVSGGCFSKASTDISIVGYTTTRGDMGSVRPVLTASGAISTFTIIATGTANSIVANLEIDCASKTSSRAMSISNGLIYKCKASNCTNNGFNNASLADIAYCEATGCSSQPAISGFQMTWGCYVHDNTITAFNNCSRCEFCIADTNTGGSSDGYVTSGASSFAHCVAYNNGRDGFRLGAAQQFLDSNVAETNTGTGFNSQNNNDLLWVNNAAYNNGTNFTIGTGKSAYNLNSVTGTGSFFTNAAGGDFSLNNTTGAGGAVRGAGALGVFPGGLSTGYLDIGAVQTRIQSGGLAGGNTLTAYFPSPTANAAANTKGSYTQVVASSPYASSRLYVIVLNGPLGGLNFLVDIATGGAGSETVVVPDLHVMGDSEAMSYAFAAIDVDIAASTRIAVRCQCSTGSQALTMAIYLENRAAGSISNPVTYGALTASSLGTTVDPGGTINTKGSYAQLTASTTARIDELIVWATCNSTALPAYQTWKLDIAIGGAGAESIKIPDIYMAGNTFADQVAPVAVRFSCPIPAGSRIAARCECSGNGVGTRELNVAVTGVQVPTPATGSGGTKSYV